MGPENETLKLLPPNKDYIRLVEKIIDQNNELLKINSAILPALIAPMMMDRYAVGYVSGDRDDEKNEKED